MDLMSKEKKAAVIEKEMDRRMSDLVEYTKMINEES